jgi:enoyl-CoA hydratase/carnithine racemase
VPPVLFGQIPLPLLKYLLFSGELIDAAAAQSAGLVFEVRPAEELTERAHALLATFAANGPEIIAAYKRNFRSYDRPIDYEDTMRGLYTDPAIQSRVRGFFRRSK